eukprot:COSAG06_NODE_1728_length_8567_cov_5.090222_2_plen_85_part_00
MPCQCFDNNMYVANVIGVIMLACTISHTCTVFVGGDRDRAIDSASASDIDSDRETERQRQWITVTPSALNCSSGVYLLARGGYL